MNQYTTAFSSLHTAKIAGKQAPHKAVLLLSIMDLVEPFYRLYMNNGQLISGGTGRYSIPWLRENTYAMLDEKLFHLMQDENARAELRVTLVSTYLKDMHSGTDSVLSALTLIGLILNLAA